MSDKSTFNERDLKALGVIRNYVNNIRNYVNNYRILMDTCSLLDDNAEKFWNYSIPILTECNKTIVVPLRCIQEVQKKAVCNGDKDLEKKAISALKKIKQLKSAGLLEIFGENSDNFADNVFNVVFTKFRMKYKMLLITQDNGLGQDIIRLNESQSVKAKTIHVRRINKYGCLGKFSWDKEEYHDKDVEYEFKSDYDDDDETDIDKFKICKVVTNMPVEQLKVSHIPIKGEEVITDKGNIKILDEIASGGEGIIYSTNTPYIAKIYKRHNLTNRKYEKLKLMLSKNIVCKGVCYPISLIYNRSHEFVGYLMPKAKGKELQKSIFLAKPLFLKTFPGWKKRDTVQLCVTILEKIKYLHSKNIIMGDINPMNILVESPTSVYFVDTDSYQIEDFPCPVGTITFTAPEIQGKKFSEFLRTRGNENFAIATLLFMIMLPGKPPYSQQGGGSPMENIKKMDFSYPFGDNSNKKTPEGPWRFIWSHLTYDIKKAFYNTFRIDGQYSAENKRIKAIGWLTLFNRYLALLDNGKLGIQDSMSEELYPDRFKNSSNAKYIECSLCHKEIPENQMINGICRKCLNDGKIIICKSCGKEFLYTNYQKYVKKQKPFEICSDCFKKRNEVKSSVCCIDCGKYFTITNGEYDYYISRGLDIPKRCKACCQKKKSYNSVSSTYTTTTSTSNDST